MAKQTRPLKTAPLSPPNSRPTKYIELKGVKQNNLKNLDVKFPLGQFTVITGVSGSGKSSLAFETLYAEGHRRYIESLSTYIRQFLDKIPKPDIESLANIPPSIALEQRNHVVNSRSTVGTQTEVLDHLRILFARAGETRCPKCNIPAQLVTADKIVDWALQWMLDKKAAVLAAPKLVEPTKKRLNKKETLEKQTSWFRYIQQFGYNRVVFDDNLSQLLSLEDLPIDALSLRPFKLVMDRMKLTAENLADEKTRIQDSIEQALRVGEDSVYFLDLTSLELVHLKCQFGCPNCGQSFRRPEPEHFSFNHPSGACPDCNGFGFNLSLDESKIVPRPELSIREGAIDPFTKPSSSEWQSDLFKFCKEQEIDLHVPYRALTKEQRRKIWEGTPDSTVFKGIRGCFNELDRYKYKLHVRVFIRRYQSQQICLSCNGSRLQPLSRIVFLNDKKLEEIIETPLLTLEAWLNEFKIPKAHAPILQDPLDQIRRRIKLLNEVGVGYLTLGRLAKTLSGGEFQRISLATQLGNGLCGTLYVLDEPSIGLHPSDTQRLIGVLSLLRDQGNTVVVVEHDLEVMRSADWIVELGPKAGSLGGALIAMAPPKLLPATSLTMQYLSNISQVERGHTLRPQPEKFITLKGCREHNLKNITVKFPLERFSVVTGLSGSGKSTLVEKTLYRALCRIFDEPSETMGIFDKLYGADQIHGVFLLDQSPIGRSSRSNPATYLKIWDEVRQLYSQQPMSLKRGFGPQHFSFNVDAGRCPVCKGEGEIVVDLHFMAEMKLPCEECDGKRFKKNVLEVEYRGLSIERLLKTTVDEALQVFQNHPQIYRKLLLLREVGLGYIQLGQSGSTLSGGESQRLKIAHTLDRPQDHTRNLYILDEPTTGLHLEDIQKLIRVMHDLVDRKQTVLLIEHQVDVMAAADWIIDIGPGGGEWGGNLVAEGTPEEIAANPDSLTGKFLKTHFDHKLVNLAPNDNLALNSADTSAV